MSDDKLKEYVEDRIKKYTFYAKNFNQEELERVDEYCKLHFGNSRKKMILTLITMVENNTITDALNEKMNLYFADIYQELDKIKKDIYKENNNDTKKRYHGKDLKKIRVR